MAAIFVGMVLDIWVISVGVYLFFYFFSKLNNALLLTYDPIFSTCA